MPSPPHWKLTQEQHNLVDLVLVGSPPGIVAGLSAGTITPVQRALVITAVKREAHELQVSQGEALEGLLTTVRHQAESIPLDRLNLLGGIEKYFNHANYRKDPIHVQERSHASRGAGTISAVRAVIAGDRTRAIGAGNRNDGVTAWLSAASTGRT
jgi:hypothetical protein